MIIRECDFCKKTIKTRFKTKRFCNSKCQKKDYDSRDEIKEKNRIRMRK